MGRRPVRAPACQVTVVSRRVTPLLFLALICFLSLVERSSYASELQPEFKEPRSRILASSILHGEISPNILRSFDLSSTELMSSGFPPLKLAIPVGIGFVPADGGYNNALLHLYGTFDKYALDVCEGNTCFQYGRHAIAPTDIKYEHTAPYINGYHYFEIHNDGKEKTCMSLGHFDWLASAFPSGAPDPGTIFPQGAVLGELNRWERIPHVHMGIWKMAAVDPYGNLTRCDYMYLPRYPQPFTGPFSLDGEDFPSCWPGALNCYSVHAGRAIESTNAAFCYSPGDLEIHRDKMATRAALSRPITPAKTGDDETFLP